MTIVNSYPVLERVAAALQSHPWFVDVSAMELSALARASLWVRFEPGDTLFSEGQAAASCLLVCEGAVQGLRYTADGGDKVFGQVGPGGWFSVLSLFQNTPRHLHTAMACKAGNGCLVNGAAFRRLCLGNAAFACRVMTHGANLIQHHTDQIDWLTSSSAEERLAEYILRAGKPQANQPVVLPLTHSQIAVKLGMRAETLSRIFAKWRRQGYISYRRGAFLVLRMDSLKALAERV